MTANQEEHLGGGYWPLVVGAFIAFVVGVIVIESVLSIPPGAEYDTVCGLGCTGSPVFTPLTAAVVGLPALFFLLYLRVAGQEEGEGK